MWNVFLTDLTSALYLFTNLNIGPAQSASVNLVEGIGIIHKYACVVITVFDCGPSRVLECTWIVILGPLQGCLPTQQKTNKPDSASYPATSLTTFVMSAFVAL